METSPAAVCSSCGESLSANGSCVACLLRRGLDESVQENAASPPSLVFGDFEIARRADGSLWELGRGAMGVTYRAIDKVLHRDVALKVIQTPSATDGWRAVRERFLREARAAAALRHPNVAGVFHLSASPEVDYCYFAMELVEGETLEARVRRDGPLKVELALEIGIQVTRALMAAAARGLIHRDLKPGNIMLTRGDPGTDEVEVKVIDFGLAKAAAEAGREMDLTHGGFVGTPTFASPEQFGIGPVDARSDIYSLGVTLWYALTGKVPCPGKTMEEIRACQDRVDLPVEQLIAKKVPAALVRLLQSCLAIDPAKRPASARELMEALESCRDGLTESGNSGLGGFFHQLKQRNVVRVAIAYGVTAWLLAQIATQIFPFFEVPNWGIRLVILVLCLGFPVALMLAWAFQITPEGVVRLEETVPNESTARRKSHKLTAVIAVVGLAAVTLFAFRFSRQNTIPAGANIEAPARVPAMPAEKSIAVLPLENLSDDKENAFFADGIQDELLSNLAKIKDLKVISRTSVMQYKSGITRNLKEIARQLGVSNVVEGSVRRLGNHVRVSVQLIDALADRHIWAQNYDRTLADSLALQGDLATEIAASVGATLSPQEKARVEAKPTNNTAAYDAYLRGRALTAGFSWDRSNMEGAIRSYQEAVKLDPSFTLAWAYLSSALSMHYWSGFDPSPARLAAAKDAVDRALAFDPNLPETHLALGYYRYYGERDFSGALAEFQQAEQGLPNNVDVIKAIALIQRRVGHWDEAIAGLRHAVELDPRNIGASLILATTFMVVRRFPEVLATADRVLALEPTNTNALWMKAGVFWTRGDLKAVEPLLANPGADPTMRGVQALFQRRYAAATEILSKALAGAPEEDRKWLLFRLGLSQQRAGDVAAARATYQKAAQELQRGLEKVARDSFQEAELHSDLGRAYAGLGEAASAIAEGQKAMAMQPASKDPLDGPRQEYTMAQIYAFLGDADHAIPLLQRLLQIPAGGDVTPGLLRMDPVWDPIRNDPRFQELAAEKTP
jgi:TolB-like protein/Flp pilus assembly protein TadD